MPVVVARYGPSTMQLGGLLAEARPRDACTTLTVNLAGAIALVLVGSLFAHLSLDPH